jgi:hypothetical protein
MCLTVALFAWPEAALRGMGWKPAAGRIEFGYPRPEHFKTLERDPELFWTLRPGRDGANSRGFVGPEWILPKPKNTFRLVFFGDSCTYQGFPRRVADRLQTRDATGKRIEAINLGVPGYSSYQGRVLAGRWCRALEPDIGLVAYSWNDHWQARGAPDAERGQSAQSIVGRILWSSRLAQGASLLTPDRGPLEVVRVPLNDYRNNLEVIGDTIQGTGSQVVLLTVPSAHAALGVPPFLLERGFVLEPNQAVARNYAYNEVVRELAHDRGWMLLDLAARADPRSGIFKSDGIHFSEAGLDWVATEIATPLFGMIPR